MREEGRACERKESPDFRAPSTRGMEGTTFYGFTCGALRPNKITGQKIGSSSARRLIWPFLAMRRDVRVWTQYGGPAQGGRREREGPRDGDGPPAAPLSPLKKSADGGSSLMTVP